MTATHGDRAETVRVEVLGPDGFAPWVDSAAAVYGAAMARPAQLVAQRREIFRNHLTRESFVAVVAVPDGDPGELVGFGYGYLGRAGEWWHDVVAQALGAEAAQRWLADAFELAELHVGPGHQGQGTGRVLLETLLAESGGRTVVLSTHDRKSPAYALYRSVGFVDLLRRFVFPGSTEVYAVLGLER